MMISKLLNRFIEGPWGQADRLKAQDFEYPRVFSARDLRAEEIENQRILRGYAAVFNQETVIGDYYREVIRPGAFSNSLRDGSSKIVFLDSHDSRLVIGRVSNGTLALQEDDFGLRFALETDDRTFVQDLFLSVQRGYIRGMSIGFQIVKESWIYEENEMPIRELLEVDLWEVSAVCFPASSGTSVSADTRKAEAVLRRAREQGLLQRGTGKNGISAVSILERELQLLEV